MSTVLVGRGEDPSAALRRLRRLYERTGTAREVRARTHHVTDSEKRQQQKAAARKRWLKQLDMMKPQPRTGRNKKKQSRRRA